MYRAWLIYDEEGAAGNRDYIERHFQLGKRFGFSFELKIRKRDRITEAGEALPDFAIVRTICPPLSLALERKGVPVFNPYSVSEICNHKGKTTRYVREHTTVPVIDTMTFSREQLTPGLLARYPGRVVKAVDGHGGRQVFRTDEPWQKIQDGTGVSDVVIQPFIRGPGKDVRVYVVGDEVIGAVERTSPDGFRSNYSLGGKVKSYSLGQNERDYVSQICRIFAFGMVGIDFILREDGSFIFNEIEDVVGARMLYQCQPETRLLERYFSFIEEKLLHYV